MQFHPTGTNPTQAARLVCRKARWGLLVLLLILWAAPVIGWHLKAPGFVAYGCAALAVLLTFPIVKSWRARGRAANWVLASYANGLWLNLRDCEYADDEPAETVLFVPFDEIVAASMTVKRFTTPSGSGGGSKQHKNVYLDIRLKDCETEKLRRIITAERQRRSPPRRHLGGLVHSQSKGPRFVPIDLPEDHLLRVKWSVYPNTALAPRIKKALAVLQTYIDVADANVVRQRDWDKLDDAEIDDLILDLIHSGNSMDAMKLLTHRRGFSTTEAHTFVEELAKRSAEA